MKRIDLLKKILGQTMTETQVQRFISYQLTQEDISFLQDSALNVLQRMPYKGFNCAAMNAIWCAIIQDHSSIPVSAVAGSLYFGDTAIFTCHNNIPYTSEPTTINEVWDGHCWLEFGGLIADISIGLTVALENVPPAFLDHWTKNIGNSKGMVCATTAHFESLNIHYDPCYSLNTEQINGLLAGIQTGR